MINWKKETTKKNYCGYCIGSPPSANCDGSCFTRKDYTYEQICNNRKDHLETKIKEIPELRQKLEDRENELKAELSTLS
jgi:hypothetical protein